MKYPQNFGYFIFNVGSAKNIVILLGIAKEIRQLNNGDRMNDVLKVIGIITIFVLVMFFGMISYAEYQHSSISGVIIDAENRGQTTTVMFEDDTIHTFYDGKETAYDLYILCKNHKNDSIIIEYKVTDDVNVNLHNRFFIEDFRINPILR